MKAADRRRWTVSAATASVLLAGTALAPAFGPCTTLPAATAVTAVLALALGGPGAGHRPPALAALAAACSLIATAAFPRPGDPGDGPWALAETVALLALVTVVARNAPHGRDVRSVAAGTLAGLAETVMILRAFSTVSVLDALAMCAFWSFGPVAAAAVGTYLRSLDRRRLRAATEARRAQRLQLAADLHDFVAHDLSGIVVQAQAAQLVAERDPVRTLEALRRIEQAGLEALASMDRTVHMLHEATDPAGSAGPMAGHMAGPVPGSVTGSVPGRVVGPAPGLAELPALLDRFRATGPVDVRLDLGQGTSIGVPREVSTTAYRTVVEALTNVRRHAPAASRVHVAVERTERTEQTDRADRTGRTGRTGRTEQACGTERIEQSDRAGRANRPVLRVRITSDTGAIRGAGSVADAAPVATGQPAPTRPRRGGLGLIGLAGRVEALGGTLTAGPHPPGWRVEARIPLEAW